MDFGSYRRDLRYLVGVSGGHDSVALLELLLREEFTNLIVCHLNHGLRGPDASGDEAFVRQLARERDLACEVAQVDVTALAESEGLSLEAAGRQSRLEFFENCGRKWDCMDVFLGHHADDQAETILLHVLRGAGLAGLSGMHPIQKLGELTLHRPFLNLRKDELPSPSRFREDASNHTGEFLRNRLRLLAFPMLADVLQHDPVPALLRLGEIASREDEFLSELSQECYEKVVDGSSLRAPDVKVLHPALQRRVIRRWLQKQMVPDCGFREVETVRDLLHHTGPSDPARANLPGDRHVRRRDKRLWIEAADAPGLEAGT